MCRANGHLAGRGIGFDPEGSHAACQREDAFANQLPWSLHEEDDGIVGVRPYCSELIGYPHHHAGGISAIGHQSSTVGVQSEVPVNAVTRECARYLYLVADDTVNPQIAPWKAELVEVHLPKRELERSVLEVREGFTVGIELGNLMP